jgi:RNA polymerase sigma factor (sigma-70 family)
MVAPMLLTTDSPSSGRLATASIERLVRSARAGDAGAWDEIVRRYEGLVWATVRSHRLADADAQDAAQATWVRLVRHLGQLRDVHALGGWLATVARRESLRTIRSSQRHVLCQELPELVADEDDVVGGLEAGRRAAAMREALGRLCERDRALLRMLAADPAPSYAEIGAALDMPIGSIGPTRARALGRLRRQIERCGAMALIAG